MMSGLGVMLMMLGGLVMAPTGVAFYALAAREKRWPSLFLLIEIVGRWWQLPSERKDGLVVLSAVGFQLALVLIVTGAILLNLPI